MDGMAGRRFLVIVPSKGQTLQDFRGRGKNLRASL